MTWCRIPAALSGAQSHAGLVPTPQLGSGKRWMNDLSLNKSNCHCEHTSVVAAHQLRPVGDRHTARDLTAGRSLAPVPGRPLLALGSEPRCCRCRSSSLSLGASSIRPRGPASVMLRLLSTSITPSSARLREICREHALLQHYPNFSSGLVADAAFLSMWKLQGDTASKAAKDRSILCSRYDQGTVCRGNSVPCMHCICCCFFYGSRSANHARLAWKRASSRRSEAS